MKAKPGKDKHDDPLYPEYNIAVKESIQNEIIDVLMKRLNAAGLANQLQSVSIRQDSISD